MATKTGNPIVDTLSYLKLSCLMLFSMFILTILGTLYQVDNGLYQAKHVFFSSWFIWKGGVPIFLGGLSCMTILTINMLVGGLIRLQITQRNFGVAIIHLGTALLLGSGMVKVLTADEGNLTLMEGQKADYFTSLFKWEIAIWEAGKTGPGSAVIIGDALLTDLAGDGSRTIKSAFLPFDLVLSGFVRNCRIEPKGPMWQSEGPPVDGYGIRKMRPNKESERDVAGMHVDAGGKKGLLWGFQREPMSVEVDGRTFLVDMRHERYDMPFTIRLEKFMKEEHPGMTMAKAYRSDVTQIDAKGNEEKIRIQMNEPLRSGNLVLFQSSFGSQAGGTYSVFSVVDNVSDKWPEYSLWVVTLGMLLTFVRSLLKTIDKQSKARARAAGVSS
jgi:hypothetical protein